MANLKLDPTIHAPNCFKVCELLSILDQVGFRLIREALRVGDSVFLLVIWGYFVKPFFELF